MMRIDYTSPVTPKISPVPHIARKLLFIIRQWEQQPFLLVMVLLISELQCGMVTVGRLLSESKLKARFSVYSDIMIESKPSNI